MADRILPPLTWTYQYRQHAQEIVPGVFLGPYTTTKQTDRLTQLGISHLIRVQSMFESTFTSLSNLVNTNSFEILLLNAEESKCTENLISKFNEFNAFVARAQSVRDAALHEFGPVHHVDDELLAQFHVSAPLACRGNILITCLDGVSRSPTFVIAYIMSLFRFSYCDAFNYVQSRRYCIFPSEAFRFQLNEYEPILCAQHVVDHSLNAHQPLKRLHLDSIFDPDSQHLNKRRHPTDDT